MKGIEELVSSAGSNRLFLNLSSIPIFHFENAVASVPGIEPFEVAPIVIIVAYSLLILVCNPILVTKLPYWFNNPRDSRDSGTKIDSLLRDIYLRMKFIYISPNEEINKLTIFDFDNNQLFIDKNYFNNFLFMNKDYKNINILLFAQTKRGINKPY